MLFLKLDEVVFGGTVDLVFARNAQSLLSQYANGTTLESAQSRNLICYSVLYEVVTAWFQYDSRTDTWV
ncbi:MAG: hypothetical protein AAGJ18_13330, partial [Bacteroidota bacterium]